MTGIDMITYPTYANPRNPLPAGVHFIGVAVYPVDDDPVQIFHTNMVARYSGTESPPWITAQTDPTSSVLAVAPGSGFFVSLPAGTDLTVFGRDVPITTPFSLTLQPGWNMQANMFPTTLPFSSLVPPGTACSTPPAAATSW